MLTSGRAVGYRIFVNLHSAVLWSIVWLFVLVLLRVLLRRDGLALVAWSALVALQGWDYSGHAGVIGLLIDLSFVVLLTLLNIFVLTRAGLPGFTTMHFVAYVVVRVPFSFDASLWWAPRGWVILVAVTVLAAYGFRTSLAGKPAFGGDWLET